MSINFNSGPLVAPGPVDRIDSEPVVPLGTEMKILDSSLGPKTVIYLKGVASLAKNEAVTYDGSFSTARAAADAVGNVAVAEFSAPNGSQYGWFTIVGGKVATKVASGFAAGAAVYLTSTAGTVDDATVSGDLIHGAFGASAIGTPDTDLAYLSLNRPYVQNV